MEKVDITWRIFGIYMLVILFMLLGNAASGQIKIAQFNAEWNKGNEVKWIDSLDDCKTFTYIDINTQKEAQKKTQTKNTQESETQRHKKHKRQTNKTQTKKPNKNTLSRRDPN